MRRAHRLRASDDFRRVRRTGRSWAHPLLVLYVARGGSDRTRVGISVSKRVGGAVVRNRVKRRVRESVRHRYERLQGTTDMMFIVRRPAATATFRAIDDAVARLLARAELLDPDAWDAQSKR